MTEEEKQIAESTPSEPPPPVQMPELTEEAEAYVSRTNSEHAVVVWSLEYCEFCWTLFKLLDAIGVPYHKARRRGAIAESIAATPV